MTRTAHRPSRRLATLTMALTIGLGGVLTGCGEDAEPTAAPSTATPSVSETGSPSTEPAESQEPEAQVIDIAFSGGTVDPSGERVEASAGEEILLRITADAPGVIHVHSTPEQELTYKAGTSELSLTIDQPGVVEVESHNLDLVIVQLEVR